MISLTLVFGIALLVGVALGTAVRQVFGERTHLSWAASVLSAITGAFLGTAVVSLAVHDPENLHPLFALGAALLGTVLVLLIATRVTTPPPREVHQLVAAGESATVEFKSTARFNLHSGKRDERIELVIAKTVAALANAEGGHLIIGVDDEGTVLGLGDDLALMKRPDIDRYELWLRDYLTNTIGAAVTTTLDVSFPTLEDAALEDQPVCWIQVPAAVRPVFLVPGKSQPPQLWVRVGNSTRQLPLDQALAYASDRWGRRRLSAIGR